jgi:putative MATE family efflux protein
LIPSPPTPLAPSAGFGASLREAYRLSWPITLSLLLHAGYRVNDQFWIGDLGPDAQAAMGLTTFMLILNFSFLSILTSGTLARVARHSGTGERNALGRTVCTSTFAALGWFTLLGAIGWATTPFWVEMAGGTGAPAAYAEEYLGTIYLVLPLIGFKPLVDSIFLGLGNTVMPMLLSVLSVAINVVLNPALIYGWWGFPAMGMEGAAWSTGISRGFTAALGILALQRWFGLPSFLRRRFDQAELWRVVRIGVPVGLSHMAYATCFLAIMKTSVAPLGSAVQAGLAVGFNGLESVSYCGMMGPAMAASSIVGRRLGAKDYAGARRGGLSCLGLSVGFALITSIIFLTAGRPLASLFTDDPEVLTEAALYLAIVAFTQAATAAYSTIQQMMTGAGRTMAMAWVSVGGNLSRVPIAWWFSAGLGFGATGIWWALNVGNLLKLGAIFLLFRKLRLFNPESAVEPTLDSPKT